MELGERRRQILAAVVNDYVRTAEPVGSESLVQRHNFGVKPATIRNELAAISDLGYLRQPHTSAGRVPSDLGYRYYVDQLMPDPALDPSETRQARQVALDNEVEIILQQSCRILSGLTQYTSLATPPQMDSISIKHVALTAIAGQTILIVTILNTGHIDHRMLEVHEALTPSGLTSMGNLLCERFAGAELSDLPKRAKPLPTELLRLGWLYKKATGILRQVLMSAADDEVFVEGTTHILRQPEFAQHAAMSAVLEALERRRLLYQILSSSLLGKGVSVIIGTENQFAEVRECSFVSASYSVGGRVCGSIGVVGPTRMDYRRAVAAVQFMASNLSDVLTSLSIW